MLAIKLPEEFENRLAELAAKTGCAKTYYVRKPIMEHLDELEEKYLIEHLEKAIKQWTLDEVELEQQEAYART